MRSDRPFGEGAGFDPALGIGMTGMRVADLGVGVSTRRYSTRSVLAGSRRAAAHWRSARRPGRKGLGSCVQLLPVLSHFSVSGLPRFWLPGTLTISAGLLVCSLRFQAAEASKVRPSVIRPTSEVSRPLIRKFWPLVLKNVASHARVEELDLHVIPVLSVHGPVELQAMIEPFRLPANLVVGQVVRVVGLRGVVLQVRVRTVVIIVNTVLIEPTRSESLREGVL